MEILCDTPLQKFSVAKEVVRLLGDLHSTLPPEEFAALVEQEALAV